MDGHNEKVSLLETGGGPEPIQAVQGGGGRDDVSLLDSGGGQEPLQAVQVGGQLDLGGLAGDM